MSDAASSKSAMRKRGPEKPSSGGIKGLGFQLIPNTLAGAFVLILVGALITEFLVPLPDPFHPPTGLRWWFAPFERNAFMRVPAVDERLNAVETLPNSPLAWAVGDHGLIIRSTDGGRTWSRGEITTTQPTQPAPAATARAPALNFAEPGDLQSDYEKQMESKRALDTANAQQKAPDPKVPAAPSQLRIVPTDSNRETSRNQSPVQRSGSDTSAPNQSRIAGGSPPERNAFFNNQALNAVDFADEQRGIAVGDEGIILRTSDGGATWTQSTNGISTRLTKVAFSGNQRAVALAAGGRVLLSRDAGNTWMFGNDILVDAQDLAFDGPIGVAVGRGGYMAYTTDGGEDWALSVPATGDDLSSVAFIGPRQAVTFGGGRFFLSRDGGSTWTFTTNAPAVEGLNQVAYGGGLLIASGSAGTRVSDDEGATWASLVNIPTGVSGLRDISVSGRTDAVAVSGNGALLATRDGGQTWTIAAITPAVGFRGVAFADDQRGAALGPGGRILFTNDNGESWSVVGTSNETPFKALSLLADGRGVALTESNELFVTEDAGYTWTWRLSAVSLPLGEASLAIAETNAELIHVASGRIYRSVDGGIQWTQAPVPRSEAGYSGIALADGIRGVAVGSLTPIAYTTNSGQSWPLSFYQVEEHLTRVALAASGWGAAVGNDGMIVHTKDDGITWARATSNTQSALKDVAFATADGAMRGVAVGVDGTILTTIDGGLNWTPKASNTDLDFLATAFAGNRHVAALSAGRILLSKDNGDTWVPVRYRRLTSPWLLVALAMLFGGVLWQIQHRKSKPMVVSRTVGIEDSGASDRPIRWGDPDHLGLKDIALGLSRFLRNRRTEPPLTIAITGEWGTGKSSLMYLLHDNLKSYGFRPVWFNAWHHQSGENLLGSLLANIREQGVPQFPSVAAIDYYLTLLIVRAKRFWLRVAVTVFLFAGVLSYYLTHDVPPSETLKSLFSSDVDFGDKTGAVGLILAIATAIGGAWRALSAFGMKPDKLIAAVATNSNDETSRLQAGARYRFAREFADFSKSLDPRTLVIFIDDLDRCRPENVVEVLEAVNFLISSGPCIVVLGMAPRWVETCVGLAFKELAEASSLAEAEAGQTKDEREPENEDAARMRDQQEFARKYLEKLINIQVAVPRLTQKASLAILRGDTELRPRRSWRYGLGTFLQRSAQAAVVVLALGVVLGGAYYVARALPEFALDTDRKSATAAAAGEKSSPPAAASNPATAAQPNAVDDTASKPTSTGAVAGFDSGQQPGMSSWFAGGDALLGVMLGTLILFTLGALIGLIAFVRGSIRTEDSPRFQKALEIMQPWIMLGGESPRSIKRFMNHLRYAAMRFQAAEEPPSEWERFRLRILQWFERAARKREQAVEKEEEGLHAPVLVALAAIHRCRPDALEEGQWATRDVIIKLVLDKFYADDKKQEDRTELDSRLRSALVHFNAEFRDDQLFEDAAEDRKRIARFRKIIAVAAHRGLEGESSQAPTPEKRAAAPNEAP